jgi:hypothetical protein
MALAIGCLLLGAVLGLRFNVLVLLPVVLVATLIIGIEGWTHTLDLTRIGLAVIVSAIALAIGFLAGAVASVMISKGQQLGTVRILSRACSDPSRNRAKSP